MKLTKGTVYQGRNKAQTFEHSQQIMTSPFTGKLPRNTFWWYSVEMVSRFLEKSIFWKFLKISIFEEFRGSEY
jgi:hypothetical protein